jgi:hypothetical protein
VSGTGPPFEPAYPSDTFAQRFRHSYRYAFCIFEDIADTVKTVEQDETKWVALQLNPQQFSLREPFATAITPTQGGGKIVESRGQIIKIGNISGTTGYLPPQKPLAERAVVPTDSSTRGQLVPNPDGLDLRQGVRSGFYMFHRLRHLFRRYGYLRRLGRTDVQMFFMDFKDDDFWRIEPEDFALQRSSRKPFSYDYSIGFRCLEQMEGSTFQADQTDDLFAARQDKLRSLPPWQDTEQAAIAAIQRLTRAQLTDPRQAGAIQRFSQMLSAGLAYINKISGTIQIGFQFVLKQLSGVLQFFQDVHDTARNVLQTPLVLLAQLDNAVAGFWNVVDEFGADSVKQELNEWLVELSIETDLLHQHLRMNNVANDTAVQDADKLFSSSRMRLGAVTDQLREPTGSSGSPDADPLLGTSGIDLVTDTQKLSKTQLQHGKIFHGEDIFAVALRLLGSINRFIDLVLINQLQFPYILSNQVPRVANTLAWGDSILFPADTPATSFTDPGGPELAPVGAGTVSDPGLFTQVVDNTQDWRDDQWIGFTVTLSNGGSTESRVVIGNTSQILVVENPWTIIITPGSTQYEIRLITFSSRLPVSPETRAYGRDLLVKFTGSVADLVIGSNKDLATVAGSENLVQAINLRARCPIGQHPIHKAYGLPQPIGRPADVNVAAMSLFQARQSLLADPRIQALTDTSLELTGDKYIFNAKLRPVLARTARPIRVQLGS